MRLNRLMGLTGSGKSTVYVHKFHPMIKLAHRFDETQFINLISGSDLPESSGLASCTKSVAFGTTFKLGGRNIHLIDTPGFDDTDRNDADILKTIAEFLKTQLVLTLYV
jgi:predicted GTPase